MQNPPLRKVLKTLKDNGYKLNRYKGDHAIYTKKGCDSIAIPVKNKDVNGALWAGVCKRYNLK